MVVFLTYHLKSFAKQNLAINILETWICVGKMNANISQIQSAEQRITDGMQ